MSNLQVFDVFPDDNDDNHVTSTLAVLRTITSKLTSAPVSVGERLTLPGGIQYLQKKTSLTHLNILVKLS